MSFLFDSGSIINVIPLHIANLIWADYNSINPSELEFTSCTDFQINILGKTNLSVIFKDKIVRQFPAYISENVSDLIISFHQMLTWGLTEKQFPFKAADINLIKKLNHPHHNCHHHPGNKNYNNSHANNNNNTSYNNNQISCTLAGQGVAHCSSPAAPKRGITPPPLSCTLTGQGVVQCSSPTAPKRGTAPPPHILTQIHKRGH